MPVILIILITTLTSSPAVRAGSPSQSPRRQRQPRLRGNLFANSIFTPVPEFTDEFSSSSFNLSKWHNVNPRWLGRQPGLFDARNVRQKRNSLRLRGRYERNRAIFDSAPDGYDNFTVSFVMTRRRLRYGYLEVCARPGDSRLSSSLWLSLDTPRQWTEIDVFEIGGGARYRGKDFRRRIHSNLHVFRDITKNISPQIGKITRPGVIEMDGPLLKSRYTTFGLDWGKRYISWIVNGRRVRKERNTHWRQALNVKLDVETMPMWFGLPSRRSLPATFRIKYMRAWSRYLKPGKRTGQNGRNTVRKNLRQSTRISKNVTRTYISLHKRIVARQFDIFGQAIAPGLQPAHDTMTDTMPWVSGPQSETSTSHGPSIIVDEHESDGTDDAVMEVFDGDVLQTVVRRDGLQRGVVAGSSEQLYLPVLPPGKRSWRDEISRVNEVFDGWNN